MSEFISEDDLNTWEGFLRNQGVDPATAAPDVLAQFREAFDEAMAKRSTTPAMGEIFKPKPETLPAHADGRSGRTGGGPDRRAHKERSCCRQGARGQARQPKTALAPFGASRQATLKLSPRSRKKPRSAPGGKMT